MTRILRAFCLGAILVAEATPLAAQTANPGGVPPGGLPEGFPPGARADYWNDPRYQEAVKRLAKVREWQATVDIKTDYATTRAPPQLPEYSFHKFIKGHLRSSVRGTFKLRAIPTRRTPRPIGTPTATRR